MPFKISNREVGDDFPPLVIAEIGINHEGSIKTAKDMVDAAVGAGAALYRRSDSQAVHAAPRPEPRLRVRVSHPRILVDRVDHQPDDHLQRADAHALRPPAPPAECRAPRRARAALHQQQGAA